MAFWFLDGIQFPTKIQYVDFSNKSKQKEAKNNGRGNKIVEREAKQGKVRERFAYTRWYPFIPSVSVTMKHFFIGPFIGLFIGLFHCL